MRINQKLISNSKNNESWLIVDIFNGMVALVDLTRSPPCRPTSRRLSEIQIQLKEGTYALQDHEFPSYLYLKDSEIPKTALAKREKGLATIRILIDNEKNKIEYLFNDPSGILKTLIEKSGKSKKYVAACINRYFAFGGIENSLLPQYFNCGKNQTLPKEPKLLENNKVCLKSKRGPNTIYGRPHRGLCQIDVDRIKAFSKKIPSGESVVLKDLYLRFCIKHHVTEVIPRCAKEEQGFEIAKIPHPPELRISERSFRRILKQNVTKIEFIRRAVGQISYDRDYKGKPGTAREGLRGAGHRYEIDATVGDIYIRSPYSKDQCETVGRPVIFLVVDTWSSMIVGVHVDFSGPDWHGASEALFNAMRDKVDYCAKFGLNISHEDWPCNLVCLEITFDRGGENNDKNMEGMLRAETGIKTVNINAYHRGDQKGTAEGKFRIAQDTLLRLEAGKVVKNPSKEAQHASRKATYSFDEFMLALLKVIILKNKTTILRDNHNFEMSRDNVGVSPIAAWNWSIENTILRPEISDEKLRMTLLPEATASVTDKGLYYNGLFYSSPFAIENRWYDTAKNEGRFHVKIRFTKTSTNNIWYCDPKTKQVVTFDLTTRSEAYKNMLWAVVLQRLESVKHQYAEHNTMAFNENMDFEMSIDELEASIKNKTKHIRQSESKGMQQNIKINKSIEAAMQRNIAAKNIAADINNEKKFNNAKNAIEDTDQNLDEPDEIPYED